MTDVQKRTAGLAVASLVLGIAGFIMIGPLGAIPAVICGHMAKSRIKASQGALEGDGLALAGIIMGYVNIGIMMLMIPMCAAIAIPAFVKARDVSQCNACINNMRQIDAAKEQVAMANGYSDGDVVPKAQISDYMKYGYSGAVCPKGGIYTVKPLGEDPDCSVHGTMSAAMQRR